MTVPDPYKAAKKPISANQNSFLTNTAAGKTSTGGVASAGNQAWAKSELANSSYTPVPTPSNKPTVTAKPLPSPNKVNGNAGAVPAPQKQPQASAFSTPQYADWQAKQNEQYANLEKLLQTPFNYNPETDVGYQAQRQLAQLRAGDATRNSLETANEKGIMGSSMNVSQLGQIQQRAEQEAAAYIPEYRQQAYGQYQDQLANAGKLLTQAGALRSQDFGEATTEAELTGQYMSPQARQLLNNLFELKSQAEQSGISRDVLASYKSQADGIRSQLSGMGVDSTLFGSNVNLNSARGNMGKAGLSTMAKQAMDIDQANDQRNYDRGILESDRGFAFQKGQQEWQNNFQQAQQEWDNNFQQGQFDWQKGQQVWENAFQEKNFQQQMKDAAASRGLQWASLSQRDKEFVADQAFRDKQFSYQKEQDKISNDLAANKASSSSSAAPTKNEIEADYYSNLDRMNEAQLNQFFSAEKKNIIADLGKSGYDALKESYGIYK